MQDQEKQRKMQQKLEDIFNKNQEELINRQKRMEEKESERVKILERKRLWKII